MKTRHLFSISIRRYMQMIFVVMVIVVPRSVWGQPIKEKVSARYFGYSISVGIQRCYLQSDIAELNQLQVSKEGATFGITLGNKKLAWRARVGLYYSSPTVPYTIDMLEGGVSCNLHILNLKKIKYRAVEPYVIMDLTYAQDRYYGSYLDKTPHNRSVSEAALLGRIEKVRSSAGAGVEFQLFTNEQLFAYLFVEGTLGLSFSYNASNPAFSRTTTDQPAAIMLGIVLGKFN